MPDRTADLIAALAAVLPPATDAAAVADALWLAAAALADGPAPAGPTSASAPSPAAAVEPGPPPEPGPVPAADREPAPAADALLYDQPPDHPRQDFTPAAPVEIAAARALPRALDVGRSLRSFKCRYPDGPRRAVDLGATVDAYTRTGELLPVLRPEPERWFEVLLLVEHSPTMELWHDTIAEFTTLLTGLGAFRRVRTLRMDLDPRPTVTDALGRLVDPRHLPERRRIVLLISDCAGPHWHDPAVWQLLHAWGTAGPAALLNPLPSRLWKRTGLDLPAVRARHRSPATRNTELAYAVPPMLTAAFGPDTGWIPLPALTFAPLTLRRWADGLMRTAPAGYDAVLVPAAGTLVSPFDPSDEDTPGPADRTAAFLHTATPAARRLAALCSPFHRMSLPLLRLVHQEVVPEATIEDLADIITSGLLDTRVPGALAFHPEARSALAPLLNRHDAHAVQSAITRHIAARRPRTGRVLPVHALPADSETTDLPPDLRPFARASADLLALLAPPRPRPATEPVGGPEPDFPAPARSSALLIGLPDGTATPHELQTDLRALMSVLTSPAGWDLHPSRCRIVLHLPDASEGVLNALVKATRDSPDALLVYVQGPVENGLVRRVVSILDQYRNGATVLLTSLRGANGTAWEADFRQGRQRGTLTVDVPERGAVRHGDSLPALLTALHRTGLPGGPAVLDLGTVFEWLYRTGGPGTRLAVGGSVGRLAVMRNRCVPEWADPVVRNAFDEILRALDACDTVPAELPPVLLALLSFTYEWDPGSEQARGWRELEYVLEGDLRNFLAPELVIRQAGGVGQADFLCLRRDGGGVPVPIEVTVLTSSPPPPLSMMARGHRRAPFTFALVLDGAAGSADRGREYYVRTGPAGCIVFLRVPVRPLEEDPVLDIPLVTAVTAVPGTGAIPGNLFRRLTKLCASTTGRYGWHQAHHAGESVTWLVPTEWSRVFAFAAALPALTRECREATPAPTRLQLVLALAKSASDGGEGWKTRQATAIAMCDLPEVRRALDADPDCDTAVIVSDEVHQELVRSGHAAFVAQLVPVMAQPKHDRRTQNWLGLTGRGGREVIRLLHRGGPGRATSEGRRTPNAVDDLAAELRGLGVRPGGVLFVQADEDALAPAADPDDLLAALLLVLGPDGTLAMSAATPESSLHSSVTRAALADLTPTAIDAYQELMPAFHPLTAPTAGRLAEALRRCPDSARSSHPRHSIVAIGPRAVGLVEQHPLEAPFGEGSPVHRLYLTGAQALLLGVPLRHCLAWRLPPYGEPGQVLKADSCVVEDEDGSNRTWLRFTTTAHPALDDPGLEEVLAEDSVSGRVAGVPAAVTSVRGGVDAVHKWLSLHG
ncbi:hypothetical protein GCM10009759_50590 [Kitasatospora saccharophila]|uniref:Uncharacterized protein n=1 Tax=Kitasatospora saccharophila TaxID=407973 RepID=A0ABN2XDX8_9ACTN